MHNLQHAVIEAFKENDWTFDVNIVFKKIENYTIIIEFCLDDFCVGIYEGQKLLEAKRSEVDIVEALLCAAKLEEKYCQTISLIHNKNYD